MKIRQRRFQLVSPTIRGLRTLTLPERWDIKETKYFPCVPDPHESYVFGLSGSVSQRSGSGSGSFYHQAYLVRIKTLIATLLWLFFTFSLWKWIFLLSRIGILTKCHGSATQIFGHIGLWNAFVRYLYFVVRCHPITVLKSRFCPCSTVFNPTFWRGLKSVREKKKRKNPDTQI